MTVTTKQILEKLSTAVNGLPTVLPLAPDVYPRGAIQSAVAAFSEFCSFKLDEQPDGSVQLEVQVRPSLIADAHRIVGELQNFLLHSALDRAHAHDGT